MTFPPTTGTPSMNLRLKDRSLVRLRIVKSSPNRELCPLPELSPENAAPMPSRPHLRIRPMSVVNTRQTQSVNPRWVLNLSLQISELGLRRFNIWRASPSEKYKRP